MFLPMGNCQYLSIKKASTCNVVSLGVGKHPWRQKVKAKLEELAQKDDVIVVEVLVDTGGLNPEPVCIAPLRPSQLLTSLERGDDLEIECREIERVAMATALTCRARRRTLAEALLRWAICPCLAVLGTWALLTRPEEMLARFPVMPGFAWTKAMVSVTRVLPPIPQNLLEAFDLGRLCERFSREPVGPARDAVLQAAADLLGRPITGEELCATRDELARMLANRSVIQKVGGLFTFVNTMWLAAIFGITISVGPVIWIVTKPVREMIMHLQERIRKLVAWFVEKVVVPTVVRLHNWGVWEALAHFAALSLTAQGSRMPSDSGVFVASSGLVATSAAMQYSKRLHGQRLDRVLLERLGVRLRTLQLLLNGLLITPVAIFHQSTLLGYAATTAFLSALGFGGAMYPFCYCIGWDNSDDMARTSVLCGLTMAGFAAARIQGVESKILNPFASSVSVLCGLGHFLALLIMSNRYYRSKAYSKNNAIMLASLLGFELVGRIYGLEGLANTTTTFFVLWALEKGLEIRDLLGISHWFVVFGGSVFTYYAALWLHAHPAFVVSVLKSMGS